MTFGFPKVKWLHLTGEVDKSVRFSCQIFSGFNIPEIIKIGQILAVIKKQKGGRLGEGTVVVNAKNKQKSN